MLNTKYKIQDTEYKVNAFTLVELIVSVGVVIVLFSVGVISLVNYRNSQEVVSEGQKIVSALRSAQNNSLSQEGGTNWGVYFENTSENGAFYVVFSGPAYSATTTYSKNVLSSNVKFDLPASQSSSSVIFAPVTGLPGAGLTIRISLKNNPGVVNTITVYANGVIDINAIVPYRITASAGTGGSISPSGSISMNEGESKSFSISANSGYAISSVVVDGVEQGAISSYEFTNIQADHTISVSFASAHTITASAGTGGNISPFGFVYVANGNSQSFSINVDSGYYISSVLVDGISQGSISSYQFTDVQADHTISATFSSSGIDPTYRYAWNDLISWIDFGYPTGHVYASSSQLTGYAYNANILEIALDCATSPIGNICSSSNFKVSKNPSTGDLSGYAWNDFIGWISFNCSDLGVCGSFNYKVNVNLTTGAFTGYAWNDVIGWISFNCSDMGVCGSSNYRVNISM
ncbi:MAG: type II secretion system protein [Candidatus Paceibacterota bacterium]